MGPERSGNPAFVLLRSGFADEYGFLWRSHMSGFVYVRLPSLQLQGGSLIRLPGLKPGPARRHTVVRR